VLLAILIEKVHVEAEPKITFAFSLRPQTHAAAR